MLPSWLSCETPTEMQICTCPWCCEPMAGCDTENEECTYRHATTQMNVRKVSHSQTFLLQRIAFFLLLEVSSLVFIGQYDLRNRGTAIGSSFCCRITRTHCTQSRTASNAKLYCTPFYTVSVIEDSNATPM